MNLLYKSTRNSDKTVTASQAILKGLADDGGLFVPVSVPKLDVTMDELKDMSYQETAYAVMKQFFTDFTEEELKHCINSAYDSKFDTEVIAPLVKVGDTYHLELFHGATIAFKDMAPPAPPQRPCGHHRSRRRSQALRPAGPAHGRSIDSNADIRQVQFIFGEQA